METAPELLAPVAGGNGKSCGDVEGATERTNAYLASVAAALSAPVATFRHETVLGSWEAGMARLLDAIAAEGQFSQDAPFQLIDF